MNHEKKIKILLLIGLGSYIGAVLLKSNRKYKECKNATPAPNIDVKPMTCKFKLELNPFTR